MNTHPTLHHPVRGHRSWRLGLGVLLGLSLAACATTDVHVDHGRGFALPPAFRATAQPLEVQAGFGLQDDGVWPDQHDREAAATAAVTLESLGVTIQEVPVDAPASSPTHAWRLHVFADVFPVRVETGDPYCVPVWRDGRRDPLGWDPRFAPYPWGPWGSWGWGPSGAHGPRARLRGWKPCLNVPWPGSCVIQPAKSFGWPRPASVGPSARQ